jgi:homeobox protein ESX1
MPGTFSSTALVIGMVVASLAIAVFAASLALLGGPDRWMDAEVASAIRADYSGDLQGNRLPPLDEGIIDDARGDQRSGPTSAGDGSSGTPTPGGGQTPSIAATPAPVITPSPPRPVQTTTPTPTPVAPQPTLPPLPTIPPVPTLPPPPTLPPVPTIPGAPSIPPLPPLPTLPPLLP